ncbi:hypothetical protein QRE65_02415 (plasmid) [Bacillus cereus]|nr:hypothetical protein QRE65_02415 [Bacillus cereus]
MSLYNSPVNRFVEEKNIKNEDNLMTPLMTAVVVNNMLDSNSESDSECAREGQSSESSYCSSDGSDYNSD